MTFVIGFKCADGVVLCTDSLEADGLTKRSVDKIRAMGTTEWGVAIGGAGAPGIIDKFCDEVSVAIGRGAYNRKHIEQTIEDVLSRFRSQYQEDDDRFRVLVGVYCATIGDSRLYRSDASHLSPIKDYAHIGTGHSLCRFLAESLYNPRNSVEDNSRVAVFIMKQAINYVDAVDGPIQLASYAFGDGSWKFPGGMRLWKLDLEGRWDIRAAIREFWSRATPPTLSEQVKKFGGVRTPGDELTLLDGVKIEELETGAGRNRVSGFLFGNRDRLRKRGILERERGQKTE